jgi:hypothetical protein
MLLCGYTKISLAVGIEGLLGPSVEMVIVPLVFHDEAVDVDTVLILLGVQLQG